MRLALPKALIDAELEDVIPSLSVVHIKSAIELVLASQRNIAFSSVKKDSEVGIAKKILGIE